MEHMQITKNQSNKQTCIALLRLNLEVYFSLLKIKATLNGANNNLFIYGVTE